MFSLLTSVQAQKWVGGDISVLQSYEDHNVSYYDQNGSKIDDVLKYMKSETVGWNAQRVRLFVNPKKKTVDGYTDPLVCQDLDYVVRLCKRIKAEGFALMLDFHYSDTWADPSNQWIPESWTQLTAPQLQTQVYEYTKECLQQLVDEGATPDFIQPGNEISFGMLWSAAAYRSSQMNRCYSNSPEANWTRFINLLNSATKACREICPQAQIVIHTERAGQPDLLKDIYKRLSSVDYDVIGLSYYPIWHNSLSVLSQSLNMLSTAFPEKEVQIVETAYYYQWQPQVGQGIIYDFSSIWPISPEGQAAFIRDLIKELKTHSNVTGLYWWFPEENGNGPNNSVLSGWLNRGLWDDNTHRALPGLYELKEFVRGEPLAVNGQQSTVNGQRSAEIFNLAGQKVANPGTGIYLFGGKKYLR